MRTLFVALSALLFVACMAADGDESDVEADGDELSQAIQVLNNDQHVVVGDSWLKLAVECMAATYPKDSFKFTSDVAGSHFILTSHDHQVESAYWYTQGGAINVAHIYSRINSPSAPWVHRAYVWSLTTQASEPSGGRVDFRDVPAGGSQPSMLLATCSIFSPDNYTVMSNVLAGN